MFAWYWLADLCEDEHLPFALGHALAMKFSHGGKTKNDKLDAAKLAALLKGGLFPLPHVYPTWSMCSRLSDFLSRAPRKSKSGGKISSQ